jgi:nucleoside-diphosphate-sugar epimerase
MAEKRSSTLVTGAAGFIGREGTCLLERAGARVIALDRNSQSGVLSEAYRKVACDITNAEELERIFEQESIDGIIHLAAILPTAAQKEPVGATEVNVRGSLNLLEAARKFGVKRFVFGSSLSIYGSWPSDHPVSEDDRAAPEDLYGAAKLYVEQLGSAYASSHGLEFVSLRIGRVVGAGAQSATSAWRSEIFEILRQDRPAEIQLPYMGSERLLLAHVEDVARMLVELLQAPRLLHTIYNAVCESMLVSDLKREVEAVNPNITVVLSDARAVGNPRRLDSNRFQREFGFAALPIAEQLGRAAKPRSVPAIPQTDRQ